MRKLILTLSLLLGVFSLSAQVKEFKGVVTTITGNPVANAKVTCGDVQVLTAADGSFTINTGDAVQKIFSVYIRGFEEQTVYVPKTADELVKVVLSPQSAIAEAVAEVVLSELDSDDAFGDQNVSSLLTASRDVYASPMGYNLGAVYFRIRGYDSEYGSVSLNGLLVRNAETMRPQYSLWGGLNDVARNKEEVLSLNPADFVYSNIGGAVNIDLRPSTQRIGTRLSYAFSNASYTNRVMATYSSGLMENGWAFTVSGSTRLGNSGWSDGTPYEGYSLFLAAEKKINEKHSLSFTAMDAYAQRGTQAAVVKELYSLMGPQYNPNWGYLDGEERNARIKTNNEPVFILNHYFTINSKTTLNSSIGYNFGRQSYTALNWYKAADPRPDYYRYLPSYDTTTAVKNYVTNQWLTNTNVSQIDWDNFYQVNLMNNMNGEQATYIVEDRRTDYNQFMIASQLHHEMSKNIKLSAGLNGNFYRGRNYKVISDLLGGEYWMDIDGFSERDFPDNPSMLQNDMNNPNRVIKEGDVFGYDYYSNINTADIWGLMNFSYNHFDYYVGLDVGVTSFWREGMMRNGRAPDNSYGESKKYNFLDFGAKGGITYKLNGRNYFVGNVAFVNQAPTFRNSFMSPRVKDITNPDLQAEQIFSGDISYVLKLPFVNLRVGAFQTMTWNQAEVMSLYEDNSRTYTNLGLTGVNKTYQGYELGAEFKVTNELSFQLAGTWGNYRYTSRPTALKSAENGSTKDTVETIYIKNFYVPSSPQTAATAGVRYQLPIHWTSRYTTPLYLSGNINYWDRQYEDFNPDVRTQEHFASLGIYDEAFIEERIQQTKLPAEFTIDLSVGTTFSIKSKYRLNLNFSVSNVLDNTDVYTGAYEQSRFDRTTGSTEKFSSKYYHGYGRTFYLVVGFSF